MSRLSPAQHHSLARFADLPVQETRLANGLRVLVWERHESPVVISDLYYPVGSVNDPAGQTGMAHFVEHMLFKGTRRFRKGRIDRLTFLAGGQANAETDEDSTHYWFALPANAWRLPLALESDRMCHARFDPDELDSERRVIAEEARRDLDQPWVRLERAHLAACYPVHPYRNPVLGWPEHLDAIGPEQIRSFYRTHYRPAGAILVVVGAVDGRAVIDQVERDFGRIPAGKAVAPVADVGPIGPRQPARLVLREPESGTRGLLAWRTVPRSVPDIAALDVLAELLGSGRHSRLWRRLVDRGQLATSIDATHEPSLRDGLFFVALEAEGNRSPDRLESEILTEIADLARRGPQAAELERVRNRLSTAWLWELDDPAGAAAGLGNAALAGDWRIWAAEYRAALDIRPDDIRRVASTYLDPDRLTAAWSVADTAHRRALALSVVEAEDVPVAHPPAAASSVHGADRLFNTLVKPAALKADRIAPIRQVMPNGMRLIGESQPGSGVLALEFYCDGGVLREKRPGVAFLAARLREEGTRGRAGSAIARVIEQAGGSLDVMPAGISIRIGADDLNLAIELLSDLVRRPTMPARALEWNQRRLKAELRSDHEDPAYRAGLEFLRLIYGRHPFGRDPRGSLSGIGRLTLADVREHQATFFTPDRSFLVVAGDFSWPSLLAAWNTHFGEWAPSGATLAPFPRPRPVRHPHKVRIASHGSQLHIVMGHSGIERTHPDYTALVVLDHILGSGPGLTDRLSRVLREELGLVYSVAGGITETADVIPGMFRIVLSTHPEDGRRAVQAVERELLAVHRGEFGDAEVRDARQYLAGAAVFEHQSIAQRAERWLELERWGLPLTEPDHWAERVARVTPAEVRRVAREHLHPEQLVRVEVGPPGSAG